MFSFASFQSKVLAARVCAPCGTACTASTANATAATLSSLDGAVLIYDQSVRQFGVRARLQGGQPAEGSEAGANETFDGRDGTSTRGKRVRCKTLMGTEQGEITGCTGNSEGEGEGGATTSYDELREDRTTHGPPPRKGGGEKSAEE